MRHRVTLVLAVLAATSLTGATAPAHLTDPSSLVVHEWGTFTSVAGGEGEAVSWLPLSGEDDLPCFVDRIGFGVKPDLSGTIRMETPVLYFYAPDATTARVTVRFRQGAITEWYPRASVTPTRLDLNTNLSELESVAAWSRVEIRPGSTPSYPMEPGPSHYYAARETDAAPLRVAGQAEKFLFYRGVGAFQPPLAAKMAAEGRVEVRARDGGAIGDILLFDNRDGRLRYRFAHARGAHQTLSGTPPEGDVGSLHRQLERLLVSHGLYEREARAMVDTWKDSWFEPGTRLIYIVPTAFVDAILPLDIRPRPSQVARVFVGRIELLTEARLSAVRNAMLQGDLAALKAHGRFVWPAVNRVVYSTPSDERARFDRALTHLYQMPVHNLRRCGASAVPGSGPS